jgi:hypothetical protein
MGGAVRLAGRVVVPVGRGVERLDAAVLLGLGQRPGDVGTVPAGHERLPDEVTDGVLASTDTRGARGDQEEHDGAAAEHRGRLATPGTGRTRRAEQPGGTGGGMQGRANRGRSRDAHGTTVARTDPSHDPRWLSQMMGSLAD